MNEAAKKAAKELFPITEYHSRIQCEDVRLRDQEKAAKVIQSAIDSETKRLREALEAFYAGVPDEVRNMAASPDADGVQQIFVLLQTIVKARTALGLTDCTKCGHEWPHTQHESWCKSNIGGKCDCPVYWGRVGGSCDLAAKDSQ